MSLIKHFVRLRPLMRPVYSKRLYTQPSNMEFKPNNPFIEPIKTKTKEIPEKAEQKAELKEEGIKTEMKNEQTTPPEANIPKAESSTPKPVSVFEYDKSSNQMLNKMVSFFKIYGKVGIGVYFSISIITMTTLVTLIHNGLDLGRVLKYFGLDIPKGTGIWGEILMAAGISKLMLPIRLTAAFTLTPIVYRRLGYKLPEASKIVKDASTKLKDEIKKL